MTQKHDFDKAAEILYACRGCCAASPYFENICLPSLAAQTDPDFRLVALIGDTIAVSAGASG